MHVSQVHPAEMKIDLVGASDGPGRRGGSW
jgi:hypothetical protein